MPGFIINKVVSLILPSIEKEKTEGGLILQALAFSCINYAVLSWLIILLYDKRDLRWLLSVLVLFIGPLIIGLIAANLIKKTFLNIRLTSSAWDYYFNKEKPVWILVTLKDGTRIGGFFYNSSFSSSGGNDIYLEEVWSIEKDGKFDKKIEDTDGCIIKNEEIKYIEFFKVKPNEEVKNV